MCDRSPRRCSIVDLRPGHGRRRDGGNWPAQPKHHEEETGTTAVVWPAQPKHHEEEAGTTAVGWPAQPKHHEHELTAEVGRTPARPPRLERGTPGLEGPSSDRLCQGGHTSGTGNWPWSPNIGRQSRCRPCFAAEGDNRYERGLPALRYIDECSRVLGGDEQKSPCGA